MNVYAAFCAGTHHDWWGKCRPKKKAKFVPFFLYAGACTLINVSIA